MGRTDRQWKLQIDPFIQVFTLGMDLENKPDSARRSCPPASEWDSDGRVPAFWAAGAGS